MIWYRGATSEESGPVGGGSFNLSDIGSEVENFDLTEGFCRGYAQTPGATGGFNLRRVGGKRIR
jgi:hypothetical protein